MGWVGIDYEELGELGHGLLARDLVAMPREAVLRVDAQLRLIEAEANGLHERTSFAVVKKILERTDVCRRILKEPRYISAQEHRLTQ